MSKPPPPTAPHQLVEAPRYNEGWRRGKPEEDPDKVKRWGFVSARPSEFLIRMRGGAVVAAGQGRTVFKWPWDSVAIVPTTVQRLHFLADQVTSEKVGVKVSGIAVYRIAMPLLAARLLNFSYPERAQEKLKQMMEEMCVGASRRLIANLTVEQCLTQRKEALSAELVAEIAPVVAGKGRVEDATHQGWGVVVDTIEIQDVRVTSAQVFANMQAGFRFEQERSAREAELGKVRFVRQDEANTERQVALVKVAAETDVRRQRQIAEEAARIEKLASDARVEEQQLAQQRAHHLARLEAEEEVRQRKQTADEQAALEKLRASERLRLAQLRGHAEAVRLKAEVALTEHQARLAEEQQAAEVEYARVACAEAKRQLAEQALAAAQLEAQRLSLQVQVELDRRAREREIENTVSPEAVQLMVAQQLPELARAFQQKMGEVHITAVDGANPFGYVAAAVEGVLGLARSAGIELKKP